jgi:drug/metabolite transporter (DMT)-like permease
VADEGRSGRTVGVGGTDGSSAAVDGPTPAGEGAVDPRRGAVDMLWASFGFAWMGLLIKQVSTVVPTGEVVAWRTLITALVVGGVAAARGTSLRPGNLRMQLVRALTGLASMSCYFFSLGRLPLGDAVLVTYLSPIQVALLSRWSTGEAVPPRVWGASLLGLLGVALVAGPSGRAADWVGLGAALLASVFATMAYLSVRVLSRTDRPEVVVFWFSAVGAVLSSASFLDGVALPDGWVAAELVAMGTLGAVAQHFMTRAYARGNAATVSVYSYATPVFAYGLGALFRGEVPPVTTLVGAGLVVAAGAFAARR